MRRLQTWSKDCGVVDSAGRNPMSRSASRNSFFANKKGYFSLLIYLIIDETVRPLRAEQLCCEDANDKFGVHKFEFQVQGDEARTPAALSAYNIIDQSSEIVNRKF